MNKEKNQVFLSGIITNIKKIDNEDSMVTMYFKDEQERFPKFICKTQLLDNIAIRDYIVAIGYICGISSEESSTRIYATSIERPKTMIEEHFPGVKGNFYYPGKAEIILSGILTSVKKEEKWERYKVLTYDGLGEETTINCSRYAGKREYSFKEGDRICLIAKISTPKKVQTLRLKMDVEISAQ